MVRYRDTFLHYLVQDITVRTRLELNFTTRWEPRWLRVTLPYIYEYQYLHFRLID